MNAVVGILGKKALGRLKDKNVDTNSEVRIHLAHGKAVDVLC